MDNSAFTPKNDIEIKPVNIYKRIALNSDDENHSTTENKLTKCKKRRIMEGEIKSSSNEDVVTENVDCEKQNKGKYMQQVNKIKRNTGQMYYTKKGKLIPAKKFKSKNCNCSKKCIDRVNESERRAIFDMFWNLGDFNKQNEFLCDNVQRETINRRRPRNHMGTMRSYSYKFYLVASDEKVLVCKKFFIETFQISHGRLDRVLKSYGNIPKDMRGRNRGSCRRTSESMINSVKEHIKSFLIHGCHYTRSKKTDKIFLNPDLNIRQMYNSYLENCKENNLSSVNEWTYRKIFKQDFNFHRHLPHKNSPCNVFKV